MKTATNISASRRGGGARQEPEVPNLVQPKHHREIGSRLRALYAEAESEPLPAHLIDLLEMLDRVESESQEPGEAAAARPVEDAGPS